MKSSSAVLLAGGVTFLSAGSAAIVKSNSPEPVDMDLQEFEEVEASDDKSSIPSGFVGYKGSEVVKFQKSLELNNSSSPGDVCSWGEFNGVGLGEDEKLSAADDLGEIGADDRLSAFLGFHDTKKPNNVKSCLFVDVDRKDFTVKGVDGESSQQWAGSFSGFGSIVNGNRAIVSLNVAETNTNSGGNKELQLKGMFYLLQKESSINDSNGRIRYYKEVKKNDNKVISAENFDRYFPKPNALTVGSTFNNKVDKNWGFMDKSDFSNIFSGDQTSIINTSFSGSSAKYEWTVGEKCSSFFSGLCDRVDAGTPNTSTSDEDPRYHLGWFDYMYGNSEGEFNLGKNLQTFSVEDLGIGVWRKK